MALETVSNDLLLFLGRLVYGGILAFMGLNHFMDDGSMSGYAESKGVPAPSVAVIMSGLLLVLGGLSLIVGVYPMIGAIFILVFFVLVTPVMHDFWTVEDPEQRQAEMTNFLKNAALFGGALALLAITGAPWPYSLGIGL